MKKILIRFTILSMMAYVISYPIAMCFATITPFLVTTIMLGASLVAGAKLGDKI